MASEFWRRRAKRLVCHPLLHFVLIGVLLFAIYTLQNGYDERGSTRIDIDRGRITWLAGTFATQFGHTPSRTELDSLINAYLSDEMSYREAVALGLDQDDSIVRRRMIQKYEFLNLDEEPEVPNDATLRKYFMSHGARYEAPTLVTLCQVYVAAIPDRSVALNRVRALGGDLEAGRADAASAGDPIDLPSCVTLVDRTSLQKTFGTFFAQTAVTLPIGRWVAPVESGYGLHAVRVGAREAGPSRFEDRRDEVRADWIAAERERLRSVRMARLRTRYRVDIDSRALDNIAPPSPER